MTIKFATELIAPQSRGLPQECVVCRNQDPRKRHIDFDSVADRGWYGNDPSTEVILENIIICEGCVEEAARLLGLDKNWEIKKERDNWERKYKDRGQQIKKLERFAGNLEDAFDNRDKPITLDHRKRPREKEPV